MPGKDCALAGANSHLVEFVVTQNEGDVDERFAVFPWSTGPLASLLTLSLLLLVPAIAAQDNAEEAHPAHIHSGTCDQLGDVVYPLADVVTQAGEAMGASGGHAVKVSEVNHVAVPLQEILDGGHAINVHLSAEEIGTYIACGTIGGIVHERENGEGMEIILRSPSSTTRGMSASPGLVTMGKGART